MISSKISKVENFLVKNGWIDSTNIKRLTNTSCTRSYIYKLNKSNRVRTIAKFETPTYTKWLRVSTHSKQK